MVWQFSMDKISEGIEGSLGKRFDQDRLRQIMAVAPDFYLHQWDVRKGTPVLLIEVPKNIGQVL